MQESTYKPQVEYSQEQERLGTTPSLNNTLILGFVFEIDSRKEPKRELFYWKIHHL